MALTKFLFVLTPFSFFIVSFIIISSTDLYFHLFLLLVDFIVLLFHVVHRYKESLKYVLMMNKRSLIETISKKGFHTV